MSWERTPGKPLPTLKDVTEKHNKTMNEGKHLSKMLGAANLKFGVDGNLYFIIGSDSYSKETNLQISKKDLPKFFEMVRDAENQVNISINK